MKERTIRLNGLRIGGYQRNCEEVVGVCASVKDPELKREQLLSNSVVQTSPLCSGLEARQNRKYKLATRATGSYCSYSCSATDDVSQKHLRIARGF